MLRISFNVPRIWGRATLENTGKGAMSNARVTNILHVLRNKVLGLLHPEPGFYNLPRDCL